MTGTFILSLDCEGKWGMADMLDPSLERDLSDARLREAYGAIRRLLDRYELPATFACVELFVSPRAHLASLDHGAVARRLPYTRAAMDALAAGRWDGWHAPWMDEMITARDERGSHGVTHTPFDQLSPDDVAYEFSLSGIARAPQTLVFPRNRVAHVDALTDFGITGYRSALERSRAGNLLSEFWPLQQSDPMTAGTPTAIPAGKFVNWRSGPRNFVPRALSRLRAKSVLDHAVATGGVAHFWTHPENVATAPATLDNLEDIVALAARYRDEGRIETMTQRDYCERLRTRS